MRVYVKEAVSEGSKVWIGRLDRKETSDPFVAENPNPSEVNMNWFSSKQKNKWNGDQITNIQVTLFKWFFKRPSELEVEKSVAKELRAEAISME